MQFYNQGWLEYWQESGDPICAFKKSHDLGEEGGWTNEELAVHMGGRVWVQTRRTHRK